MIRVWRMPSSLSHTRLRVLCRSQKQEASISDKESGTPASPFIIRFLPTARLRNLGATWTSCVTQGGNLTCGHLHGARETFGAEGKRGDSIL